MIQGGESSDGAAGGSMEEGQEINVAENACKIEFSLGRVEEGPSGRGVYYEESIRNGWIHAMSSDSVVLNVNWRHSGSGLTLVYESDTFQAMTRGNLEEHVDVKFELKSTRGWEGGGVSSCVRDSNPLMTRKYCIDSMMRKTVIKDAMENGIDKLYTVKTEHAPYVRKLYEMIYDAGDLISPILKYLQVYPYVEIFVECGSATVYKNLIVIEERYKDRYPGRGFTYMLGGKVFFGGLQGWSDKYVSSLLAMALMELAVNLMFLNEGRPYEDIDNIAESEFDWIMRNYENKMKGPNANIFMKQAFCQSSQPLKYKALIPAVAAAIVQDPPIGEIRSYEIMPPPLFEFYEDHVLYTMINDILLLRHRRVWHLLPSALYPSRTLNS